MQNREQCAVPKLIFIYSLQQASTLAS